MIRSLLALAAVTMPATSGEIFGDIRHGDEYVAKAPVALTCGTETVKGTTDDAGSFRLTGKGAGKCTLTVTWQKADASVEVVVFEKPMRYRLMLEVKDGKVALKRV